MSLPKIEPIVWRKGDVKKRDPDRLSGKLILKPPLITMVNSSRPEVEPLKKPLNHDPDVAGLLKFFESFKPQPGTIRLNVCTIINDQEKYIEGAILRIQNNLPHSRIYQAEVYRLQEYYKLFN